MKSLSNQNIEALERTLKFLSEIEMEIAGTFGADSFVAPDGLPSPEQVTTYSFAIVDEVLELAKAIGWKPWKRQESESPERLADEFADILAMLGILVTFVQRVSGLSWEELAIAFAKKCNVNWARFSGEYEDLGYLNFTKSLPKIGTFDEEDEEGFLPVEELTSSELDALDEEIRVEIEEIRRIINR